MKAYLEIEMPRCCNKCPMLVYEGHVLCICRALPAIEEGEILKPWKNRRKDCPLKPIQPHGRLIDADEMKGSIRKQTAFLRLIGGEFAEIAETLEKGFLQEIDNALTVIPAEEGE